MLTLSELTSRHAQPGNVEWLEIRPERRADLIPVETVQIPKDGPVGDHYSGNGKRSVTLIQFEHLPVIASLLKQDSISPESLRQNIVVSGINLLVLRNSSLKISSALLKATGIYKAYSHIKEIFWHAGNNTIQGNRGITSADLLEGKIKRQDQVLKMATG